MPAARGRMRLGLFGGTFNPIHLGHLILAESAREQHQLDEVWFIPTGQPPHKSVRGLVDGRLRLQMVRAAVRGHAAFRASDLELRLGGISYTLRTLQWIHERLPRAELFVIVGSDLLKVQWRGLDEIKRLATFLVADRGVGPRASARGSAVARWRDGRPIRMPQLEISSSMIRDRWRRGESIRYLVPDGVERLIARHRLYREASR